MRETMQNVNQYKFIDELRKTTVFRPCNSPDLPEGGISYSDHTETPTNPDEWKVGNSSVKWEKVMDIQKRISYNYNVEGERR